MWFITWKALVRRHASNKEKIFSPMPFHKVSNGVYNGAYLWLNKQLVLFCFLSKRNKNKNLSDHQNFRINIVSSKLHISLNIINNGLNFKHHETLLTFSLIISLCFINI